MSDANYSRLKGLLDEQNQWPCRYIFKFVVPQEKVSELTNILPIKVAKSQKSRSGKFTSLTLIDKFNTSDEIISIYKQAAQVKGVITL